MRLSCVMRDMKRYIFQHEFKKMEKQVRKCAKLSIFSVIGAIWREKPYFCLKCVKMKRM